MCAYRNIYTRYSEMYVCVRVQACLYSYNSYDLFLFCDVAEYIWAQHVNGEMVIFSPEARHFKMVPQPSFSNHFICISASHDSLWGLTANGTIYVRNAVRNCCPEGVNWVRLDLEQLGKLINIFYSFYLIKEITVVLIISSKLC